MVALVPGGPVAPGTAPGWACVVAAVRRSSSDSVPVESPGRPEKSPTPP